MHNVILSLFVFFLFYTNEIWAQKDYLITDFGAKPTANFNNQVAIQAAIDKASVKGGQVIIPAGNFMTGPLFLKNNVSLFLHKDAVLLGSPFRKDYPNNGPLALLNAHKQINISIVGTGIIDGQGRELVADILQLLNEGLLSDDNEWLVKRPTERNRTNLMFFTECENITVKNVTLKDAASWVQNYKQCNNVLVDHIKVLSNCYWNNDGIDIVDSKNVQILNSYFNVADDGICLKSEDENDSCTNVLIKNCTVRSSASGFKIGTGSLGGFSNIRVDSLNVFDTYRSAIALESVDGAFIRNVSIENVIAKNTGNAIFIRLGHRNTTEKYSTIDRITIKNVNAEIPERKPDLGYPMEGPLPKIPPHNLIPSSIVGLENNPISNVKIENVHIVFGGGGQKEKAWIPLDSLASVPENITGYPEFTMFGELPASGLYVRHAKGVSIFNFDFVIEKADYRPALVFDNVKGIILSNMILPSDKATQIVLKGSTISNNFISQYKYPKSIVQIDN